MNKKQYTADKIIEFDKYLSSVKIDVADGYKLIN